MTRSRRARWINAVTFAALAVFQFIVNGPTVWSWVFGGILLGLAGSMSPLFRTRAGAVTHAQAQQLLVEAGPGAKPVIIYHRPGCSFCARLKASLLGVRSKVYWVDVWDDPEASAYVKSVNNGNETVPTVVIDGVAHTNPPPLDVRSALTAA